MSVPSAPRNRSWSSNNHRSSVPFFSLQPPSCNWTVCQLQIRIVVAIQIEKVSSVFPFCVFNKILPSTCLACRSTYTVSWHFQGCVFFSCSFEQCRTHNALQRRESPHKIFECETITKSDNQGISHNYEWLFTNHHGFMFNLCFIFTTYVCIFYSLLQVNNQHTKSYSNCFLGGGEELFQSTCILQISCIILRWTLVSSRILTGFARYFQMIR